MGQFDKIIKQGSQIVVSGGEKPSVVTSPTGPGRVIPREIVAEKDGAPIDINQDPNVKQGGKAPSTEGNVMALAAGARVGRRRQRSAANRAQAVEDIKKKREDLVAGLSTTTMRPVTSGGVTTAYDTEDVQPVKANPISRLFAKGKDRRPFNTSAKPADWKEITNPDWTAETAAEAMDPGKAEREAKYAADAETEAKRLDLLRGEHEFNARQASSGSTMRSLNGITFDTADRRKEVMASKGGEGDFGTYQSDLESAAAANDVIPKSPYKKGPVDKENQDDYRPSSVVPTDLKALDAETEGSDLVDYSGREVGDSDLTTDAPVKEANLNTAAKTSRELTQREKEVLENEQQLTNAGLEDSARERRLKGKRGERFDENDSPLPDAEAQKTKHQRPRQFIQVGDESKAPKAVIEEDIEDSAAYEGTWKKDKKTGEVKRIDSGKLKPGYDDPNSILSTTMREVDAEGPLPGTQQPVSSPSIKADNSKEGFNTAIPLEALNTDYDEGLTTAQIHAKNMAQVKNRVPSGARGTAAVDANTTMAKGNRGRTAESELTDLSRMAERNAMLTAGVTTHSQEVLDTAKSLGISAGLTAKEVNDPLFNQLGHVTKAFVMHESGNADNQEAIDAHIGGNPLEADSRLKAAYKSLNFRKRFRDTSKAGSGYTYSFNHKEGAGKVNETDYFRTKGGQKVPMSNTMHPEHPLANGKVMEGSAVPFRGLVKNEDGTQFYTTSLHHGWHPYRDSAGDRVFEHHTIGPDSVHEGDITEAQINGKVTTPALQRGLDRGKDTGVEVAGASVTAAPKAPIKGATPAPEIPTFNPLSVMYPRVSAGVTGESEPARRPRALKLAQAHDEHVKNNDIKTGCKYCSAIASQASRDSHADIAQNLGDQIVTAGVSVAQAAQVGAPKPAGGVGRRSIGQPASASKREGLTAAEAEGKKNKPTRDDSKIVVPTLGKQVEEPDNIMVRLRRSPGKHGTLNEITEAKRSGNISADEAVELATDAGYFKPEKD